MDESKAKAKADQTEQQQSGKMISTMVGSQEPGAGESPYFVGETRIPATMQVTKKDKSAGNEAMKATGRDPSDRATPFKNVDNSGFTKELLP